MVLPVRFAQKRAFGNDSWGFAPVVADLQLPTITELEAISGINLSCGVFGDQEGFTGTTEKISLPRMACDTDQFEVNGTTSFAMADLMVLFDPQAAEGAPGKKAWETLEDMIEGVLWRRQGVPAKTDLEVGQFIDLVPVQLGTKIPSKTSTGADGVYAFMQPASIVGPPAWNVPLLDAA